MKNMDLADGFHVHLIGALPEILQFSRENDDKPSNLRVLMLKQNIIQWMDSRINPEENMFLILALAGFLQMLPSSYLGRGIKS